MGGPKGPRKTTGREGRGRLDPPRVRGGLDVGCRTADGETVHGGGPCREGVGRGGPRDSEGPLNGPNDSNVHKVEDHPSPGRGWREGLRVGPSGTPRATWCTSSPSTIKRSVSLLVSLDDGNRPPA